MRKVFEESQIAWQKSFSSSGKVKALAELELVIDIMLVLSNVDLKAKKVEGDPEVFRELLSLLKFTEIKEETKDKLEALEIFGL